MNVEVPAKQVQRTLLIKGAMSLEWLRLWPLAALLALLVEGSPVAANAGSGRQGMVPGNARYMVVSAQMYEPERCTRCSGSSLN